MGDDLKKCLWCSGGVCCVLIIAISITLIATSIHGLSATDVGLDISDAFRDVNRGQLFKQGTHSLGPFHRFIEYPTDVQSVQFDAANANILNVRTKDGMALNITLSYQFRVIPSLTGILQMFDDWGEDSWRDP